VYFIKRGREAVRKVIWNGLGLESADVTQLVLFLSDKKVENLEEVVSSVGK
jgi:hypothetical protein